MAGSEEDLIKTEQAKKRKIQDDQEPDIQLRTIYMYRLKNHKDTGFIKEQSISILHLEFYKQMNVIRTHAIQEAMQITYSNSSKGNSRGWKNRWSDSRYTSVDDILEGNTTNDLLFASFDPIIVKNGSINTKLYLMTGFSPAYLVSKENMNRKARKNPTDFELTDVEDLYSNYQFFKPLYTIQNEIKNPTKISLGLDNYSLLSKVMVKGSAKNKDNQDIDLEIDPTFSSKLSLLKFTPTSTNYKLSLFSEWLDFNRTLPFIFAKDFIAAKSLKNLFKAGSKFNGWSDLAIKEAYETILAMMKLTKAFATNFTEYRIKDDKTPTDDGAINPKFKINGISLIDFSRKDAIPAIDGFVEKFNGKYASLVESNGYKIFMEVIQMLSVHINSTYATAKGNNQFNKVYLPWYFIPKTSITQDLDITADFNVELKSQYFNLKVGELLQLLDKFKDISGYIAHDINGWISQPELPNKIVPINKFSQPGDVQTKTDNDLKYLFYFPYVNSLKLQNLYGSLHTTSKQGWNDSGYTSVFESFFEVLGKPGDTKPAVPNINALDAAALIQLPVNERLKGNPFSIEVTDLGLVFQETSKPIYGAYNIVLDPGTYIYKRKYKLKFSYKTEVNSDFKISNIHHAGTIFDKVNWRSVANDLNDGAEFYWLSLLPTLKLKQKIEKIDEINIQSVWLDNLSFEVQNATDRISFDNIQIPNSIDETLTNLTLIF